MMTASLDGQYENFKIGSNIAQKDSNYEVRTPPASLPPTVNHLCKAIFDKRPDEEIIPALLKLNPTLVNEKSSEAHQTLLYAAARWGRVEIVRCLLEFDGIVVGGPQYENQKSTPLHGANWGGHIDILAMLLLRGAKPEPNCVTQDGRGLTPAEEGNSNLPTATLEALRLLWSEYEEDGLSAMYKYLPDPAEGSSPNVPEKNKSNHRNSMLIFQKGDSFPVGKEEPTVRASKTLSVGAHSSAKVIKLPTSSSANNSLVSTSPNTPKQPSSPNNSSVSNGLLSSSPTSNDVTANHSLATVSLYDNMPKYGPQYKRFPYIFYYIGSKGEPQLYDLCTTSKLNDAIKQDVPLISSTIKNKKIEIHLDKRYHIVIGEKKPKPRNFEMVPRIKQWYWRDDDGTIKSYDEKTNMEIAKRVLQNANTLRITIGKWSYEILLDIKKQKNLKSETMRDILTEDDLANIQKWWEPQILTQMVTGVNKKAELFALPPQSEEWERVSQFFHVTMPSKIRTGVLDRAIGNGKASKFRDGHTIVKIEKIVNPTLRQHWEHELQMVKRSYNNDTNVEYVKLLFHGTSKTPPEIIYEADKGWKISYSRDDSLWGRGLYFALDSIYTHNYSYKTKVNTRKVFLAEVIVGEGIHCEEDSTLREPPVKENGKRYDSVIGQRHDTWIWITYDDARAYPTYLIEYNSN